jgi:glycosyltransferase involved in cell wall biosynthesis
VRGTMTVVRILHLVTRSQRRGAELVALELARGLDGLGHENRVVALGLAFDGTEDAGISSLTRRPDSGLQTLFAASRALRRELRRAPVDVVIAHGGRAVEAAVLVRRRGRPLVVWQRILGFPSEVWRPIPRLRWRAVVNRIDTAVALTPDLGDELRRLGFAGPVWTIANFRDPAPFASLDRAAASREVRDELGIPADAGLIGFVGHLIEQKRPDRALDALVATHDLGEKAHLVVAGDGPLRRRLEEDVEARGLTDFVHVLGHRDDIPHLLAAIDVFILTSDHEGLPGVLIEAQMAGCPVVTVPVGGVSKIVDNNETGYVTNAIDAGKIAERVVELLRNPELRNRMSEAARSRPDRFSLEEAARIYSEHLLALPAETQTSE